MLQLENPHLVMTRPLEQSVAFLASLRSQAGPFREIISPAFELMPLSQPQDDFEAVIFTSQAAVRFAPKGAGRRAWCVGARTALSAKAKGYSAISADGGANELIALILSEKPEVALVHMRGEKSHGNVTGELLSKGLRVREQVIYKKQKMPPSTQLLDDSVGLDKAILPLFSAETVSIINGWQLKWPACYAVAISPAVAAEIRTPMRAEITIAARPNHEAMIAACACLIA